MRRVVVVESTFWIATNCNANENGTDCATSVQPGYGTDRHVAVPWHVAEANSTMASERRSRAEQGGAGRSRAEPVTSDTMWHTESCNLTWIDFTRTLNSKDTKSSWWVHVYRTHRTLKETWTAELKKSGKQTIMDRFVSRISMKLFVACRQSYLFR
jgi:hypothetical protein